MPYKDPLKQKAYAKKWNAKFYRNNAAAVYARVKARRAHMRDWLDDIRSQLVCSKCGEKHPGCLDFHHPDKKTKDFNVGNVRAWGWGKEKMLLEIGKCVVLCANCHRKMHYEERRKK